jgi:hypothetical protein
MYFTFPCPSCGKKLKVQEETAGRKCGCPYCKSSITVPQPPEENGGDELDALKNLGEIASSRKPAAGGRPSTPTTTRTRGRKAERKRTVHASTSSGWSDRTDVSMMRSGLMGLVFSAVFLGILFPFREHYLGQLFTNRGWVPYVLIFLFGWSVSILWLKSRKLKRQRNSMLFDLLPTDISRDITVDSVDKFVENIGDLPIEPSESFLVNRVVHGLEHFRVRKSNPEVASMLASQSEIDANAVQSSYTLINVFIWAIPILGFIGTVIGISAAVGGFSGSLDQAQDISVLKESLNSVTSGLATAFDTTLIALVMSIMVMFPSSSMQKAEEDMLNSVDEYCNENLLKRLNDGQDFSRPADGKAGGTSITPAMLRQAIDAAMVPHHAELKSWNERLEAVGQKLTEQVVEGYEQVIEKLRARQDDAAEQSEDLDVMVAAFNDSLKQMTEGTVEVQQQAAASIKESADSLSGYFDAMQRGLAGLNEVLEGLGERQVVVQNEPRRGWFSFRRNHRG